MANNRITIQNAEIIWKNFAGAQKKFNKEGERSFTVVLKPSNDEEHPLMINESAITSFEQLAVIVNTMVEAGWNIKVKMPDIEGEPPFITLPVKVSYENFAPKVWLVHNGVRQLLDEDTVSNLDDVSLKYCDMQINPYHWSVNGDSGIKAYLNQLYAILDPEDLAAKYANIGVN